ncbi:SRPBCC family protein [Ornithinibacillus bavariensis]|uniref:Activator of Hsp90 ATPase homologue 1/2-like C-terminal domain-containing protein n=1 Tax=Ornithinibacillus bavariensis TaxID=545502 RepID=A0A919XAJ1_9BACI|nr:SRPBCC domain-containing protein [Ornithinibacillus bavariensis]GIO28576.1 hypothetical protein J43TS3_31870 [Ornithinibacillus bavariensis]
MESKPIGQTKAVGFQVGVRRTFPISQEKAWELVTSAEGFELWLGLNTSLILKPGQAYIAKTGAGELRVVKPLEQLRLTWKKDEWHKPSTVQIRFIPKEHNKTTISFHQENLPNQNVREEMKEYWENVLEELRVRF